jgi:ribosomal protein L30E
MDTTDNHDHALFVVNSIKGQCSTVAREIVLALDDGKVAGFEGLSLTMKVTTLGAQMIALFESMPKEVRQDVLYVLEHSRITLD